MSGRKGAISQSEIGSNGEKRGGNMREKEGRRKVGGGKKVLSKGRSTPSPSKNEKSDFQKG